MQRKIRIGLLSVSALCSAAVICGAVSLGMLLPSRSGQPAVPETEAFTGESTAAQTQAWSAESLKKGLTTAIEYDKQYVASISSKEEAEEAIRAYGVRQRESYSNPAVEQIELQMEQDFDILAVNLGEIEEETAEDILAAFCYMYEAYPQLRGSITNISLGNFENELAGVIAATQSTEFIFSEGEEPYSCVVKYEIIFNASKFLNREKLLEECEYQAETGYWPAGTDISSIVVHELGHQLLNVVAMEWFGLENACYITEENAEAYRSYTADMLMVNQTVAKRVSSQAYGIWQVEYAHTGSEADFRAGISAYAGGEQADGKIIYGEAFAEAVADVYLNGEQASDASKAMLEALQLISEEN